MPGQVKQNIRDAMNLGDQHTLRRVDLDQPAITLVPVQF